MELELKRVGIQLKFGDQVYPLKALKLRQQKEISQKFQAAKENVDQVIDLYFELFMSLGLPEAVIDEMDMEFLNKLFMAVLGLKKNEPQDSTG